MESHLEETRPEDLVASDWCRVGSRVDIARMHH